MTTFLTVCIYKPCCPKLACVAGIVKRGEGKVFHPLSVSQQHLLYRLNGPRIKSKLIIVPFVLVCSGDELLLTEMIFNGVFNELTVQQCVVLLSCFVFEEKVCDIQP